MVDQDAWEVHQHGQDERGQGDEASTFEHRGLVLGGDQAGVDLVQTNKLADVGHGRAGDFIELRDFSAVESDCGGRFSKGMQGADDGLLLVPRGGDDFEVVKQDEVFRFGGVDSKEMVVTLLLTQAAIFSAERGFS